MDRHRAAWCNDNVVDVHMFIIDYFLHDEIVGVRKLVHFLDNADSSNLQKSALASLAKRKS